MSVTQYIGARYVPLFADPAEWTNERAYEPLTIALHEGNSYTSRQAVPIGIEITNTDFWVLTGNYNAQVEAYRQEVRGFETRIEEAETAVEEEAAAREAADTALQQQIEGDITQAIQAEAAAREAADTALQQQIEGDITQAIQTEAATRAAADTALESEIKNNNFENSFVVFISDSYGRGVGGTEGQGWTYHCAQVLKLETRYLDISNSGAGFVATGHSPGLEGLTFNTQVDYAAQHLPNGISAADVDYVIFGGGYNDHAQSGIQSAAKAAFNNAFTKFPNAKVIFYPMCVGDRELTASYNAAYGQMVDGCWSAGAQAYQESLYWLYPFEIATSYGDQIHPNAVGYTMLGRMVASTINGGIIPAFAGTYAASAEGFAFAEGATNQSFRAGVTNGFAWYGGRIDRVGAGDLCTLPSYCRPRATTYPLVFYYANSANQGLAKVRITSNGLVSFMAPIDGTYDASLTYQLFLPETVLPLGHNYA